MTRLAPVSTAPSSALIPGSLLRGRMPRGAFTGRVAVRTWRRQRTAALSLVEHWRRTMERLGQWPLERPRLLAEGIWKQVSADLAAVLPSTATAQDPAHKTLAKKRIAETSQSSARQPPPKVPQQQSRRTPPRKIAPPPETRRIERAQLELWGQGKNDHGKNDHGRNDHDWLLSTGGRPRLRASGEPKSSLKKSISLASLAYPEGAKKSIPIAEPYPVPSLQVAGKISRRLARNAFQANLRGQRASRAQLLSSLGGPRVQGASERAGESSRVQNKPGAVAPGDFPPRQAPFNRGQERESRVHHREPRDKARTESRTGSVEAREATPSVPSVADALTGLPSFLPRTVTELESRVSEAALNIPVLDAQPSPGNAQSHSVSAVGHSPDDDFAERLRRLLADEARRHGIKV
jgi:hypothetical protein